MNSHQELQNRDSSSLTRTFTQAVSPRRVLGPNGVQVLLLRNTCCSWFCIHTLGSTRALPSTGLHASFALLYQSAYPVQVSQAAPAADRWLDRSASLRRAAPSRGDCPLHNACSVLPVRQFRDAEHN